MRQSRRGRFAAPLVFTVAVSAGCAASEPPIISNPPPPDVNHDPPHTVNPPMVVAPPTATAAPVAVDLPAPSGGWLEPQADGTCMEHITCTGNGGHCNPPPPRHVRCK